MSKDGGNLVKIPMGIEMSRFWEVIFRITLLSLSLKVMAWRWDKHSLLVLLIYLILILLFICASLKCGMQACFWLWSCGAFPVCTLPPCWVQLSTSLICSLLCFPEKDNFFFLLRLMWALYLKLRSINSVIQQKKRIKNSIRPNFSNGLDL